MQSTLSSSFVTYYLPVIAKKPKHDAINQANAVSPIRTPRLETVKGSVLVATPMPAMQTKIQQINSTINRIIL